MINSYLKDGLLRKTSAKILIFFFIINKLSREVYKINFKNDCQSIMTLIIKNLLFWCTCDLLSPHKGTASPTYFGNSSKFRRTEVVLSNFFFVSRCKRSYKINCKLRAVSNQSNYEGHYKRKKKVLQVLRQNLKFEKAKWDLNLSKKSFFFNLNESITFWITITILGRGCGWRTKEDMITKRLQCLS